MMPSFFFCRRSFCALIQALSRARTLFRKSATGFAGAETEADPAWQQKKRGRKVQATIRLNMEKLYHLVLFAVNMWSDMKKHLPDETEFCGKEGSRQ